MLIANVRLQIEEILISAAAELIVRCPLVSLAPNLAMTEII